MRTVTLERKNSHGILRRMSEAQQCQVLLLRKNQLLIVGWICLQCLQVSLLFKYLKSPQN